MTGGVMTMVRKSCVLVCLLALPVAGIDRPAREDPDTRHEAGLGIPLNEQDLEAALGVLPASAQEDHRRGGPRDSGFHFPRA